MLSAASEFDPYRDAGVPVEEANRVWRELQMELAALSTDLVHVVTLTGPHTVQYEEPRLVAGVILELVERVRARAVGR